MADLTVDLSAPTHLHIVGIGGTGMRAIASILAGMGHTVSGSDLRESRFLDRLRAQGIRAVAGHDPANLGDATVVARSTAIGDGNREVQAARERGIPVLSRADLLAAICATRRVAAVSGSHGKTTTTSMLGLMLVEAGMRPSLLVGADVHALGSGAVWDSGEWFVVEADESDGTFLRLGTEAAILTNIERDHLDQWGGFDELTEAFETFLRTATGPRVVCVDEPTAAGVVARLRTTEQRRAAADTSSARPIITYGTSAEADYRIVDVDAGRVGVRFSVEVGGAARIGPIDLAVPGLHNARNATAALALAVAIGVPADAAVATLGRFAGVAARWEIRGETGGVTFVLDHADHPGEVKAALDTARAGGWDRVLVIIQPHRYSRIEAVWADFGGLFDGVAHLVVTDIFASGETPRPGVTGQLVVDAVTATHPALDVAYLPHRAELVPHLAGWLRPGDLCLMLEAGDLAPVLDEIQALLR